MQSDFNLTSSQIENLLKLPSENKKSIYKSYLTRKKRDSCVSNAAESVEYYVEAIDNLIACLTKRNNHVSFNQQNSNIVNNDDEDNFRESLTAVEDLKLSLRTSPLRFVWIAF